MAKPNKDLRWRIYTTYNAYIHLSLSPKKIIIVILKHTLLQTLRVNLHQDATPFSPQNICSSNITILRKPHIRHPPLGRASKQLHIRLLPLQLVLVQPHRPLPILHPRLRLRLRLHFPLTDLQKPSRHQLPARHPTQYRQHIQLEWTIHDAYGIDSLDNSQNQRVESFLSFFAFAY